MWRQEQHVRRKTNIGTVKIMPFMIFMTLLNLHCASFSVNGVQACLHTYCSSSEVSIGCHGFHWSLEIILFPFSFVVYFRCHSFLLASCVEYLPLIKVFLSLEGTLYSIPVIQYS